METLVTDNICETPLYLETFICLALPLNYRLNQPEPQCHTLYFKMNKTVKVSKLGTEIFILLTKLHL